MTNIHTNSAALTLADFRAIDIVLADPSRFDELSTQQREYMQNVSRAVPSHSGYRAPVFGGTEARERSQALAEDGIHVCRFDGESVLCDCC